MKILHVSDLHGWPVWLDWVETNAGRFDAVVIAGDFLNLLSGLDFTGTYTKDPDLAGQAKRCGEWLTSIITPTIICTGNHDCALEGGGWLRDLRGKET